MLSIADPACCARCGQPFTSRRSTARYCGPTCRVAAHRKTDCNANLAPENAAGGPPVRQNCSKVYPERSAPNNAPMTSKPLSITRGYAIVADSKWPGMYRIRKPDGTLTDMVNLIRAKDALRSYREAHS
jgi:hypothetical protein